MAFWLDLSFFEGEELMISSFRLFAEFGDGMVALAF